MYYSWRPPHKEVILYGEKKCLKFFSQRDLMMCGLPTYLHVALNNRPNSLASSYGSISTLRMQWRQTRCCRCSTCYTTFPAPPRNYVYKHAPHFFPAQTYLVCAPPVLSPDWRHWLLITLDEFTLLKQFIYNWISKNKLN